MIKMTEYTKDKPWLSDAVKGNIVECYEEGTIATCHWKNRSRNDPDITNNEKEVERLEKAKQWKDVFILTSEKVGQDQYKEKICFTTIGKNLIKGTKLEKKTNKDGCIEL